MEWFWGNLRNVGFVIIWEFFEFMVVLGCVFYIMLKWGNKINREVKVCNDVYLFLEYWIVLEYSFFVVSLLLFLIGNCLILINNFIFIVFIMKVINMKVIKFKYFICFLFCIFKVMYMLNDKYM